MAHRHPGGMQEHPAVPGARQRPVQAEVGVLRVAGDRMPDVREVDPDLVRPAGLYPAGHASELAEVEAGAGESAHPGQGRLAASRVDRHPALALGGEVPAQGNVDRARTQGQAPLDDREVVLAGGAFAQLRMQADQRLTALGEHQDARGVPVDTVDELQEALLGAGRPQHLDHARVDAAAAMDGDAGRLVDDEQGVVLVQYRKGPGAAGPRRVGHAGGGGHGVDPQGRNTDRVADLEPGIGSGPAAVDPHLAVPDDPVQVAAGHAAAFAHEEIVQPLAAGALVDGHHAYRGRSPARSPTQWAGRSFRADPRPVRRVSVM